MSLESKFRIAFGKFLPTVLTIVTVLLTSPHSFGAGTEKCSYLLEDVAYAEAFAKDIRGLINTNQARLDTLVEVGVWSPKRREIYGKLGFTFKAGEIQVPDPAVFFSNFEKLVIELGIPAESQLLPVRIYRDEKQKMKVLKIFRKAPAGWKPEPNAVAHSEYERLLRNGFFPLFEPGRGALGGLTFTWHDLSHLVGWLEHPAYAKSFRNSMIRIENLPKGSFEWATPLGRRLNFVLEWMAFPRVTRDKLVELLAVSPELAGKKQIRAADVERWLNETPGRAEIHYEKFMKTWPTLMDYFGGAIDDGMIFRFNHDPAATLRYGATFDRSIGSYSGMLENLLETTNALSDRTHHLAAVYSHLLELSKTSPEQIVQEAIQEKIDPNSSFFKIFCGTGNVTTVAALAIMGCT